MGLLGLAACGRLRFGTRAGDGGPGDPDGPSDSITFDTTPAPCIDGDGVCDATCVGMDSDCVAVCGDGMCVGNAGETCGACAADCAVLAPVCGNGHCDSNEDSVNCETDCGPAIWPWDQFAADAVTMFNAVRTAGYTCPGGSLVTASAFVTVADPTDTANHVAWEIAHQQYLVGNNECNGTAFNADRTAAGFGYLIFEMNSQTAAELVSDILSSSSLCPKIMQPSYTQVVIGAAFDLSTGWAILLK